MSQGKFALCVYRYRGPTCDYLNVNSGTLVVVWQTEGGWVGALDLDSADGAWGWLPLGYVRFIDDETVAVLEPIAQQLRIGAFQAMTAIRATATDPYEGYSSPDSNESDTLGDEWAHIPKQRRSRATSRPREMRESIEEIPPVPQSVQFAATSPPPSFPRRAFRLRSKSRDGTRSDSEPSRSRRPSVSLRRTRVSMFGQREPNPVEQMRKLEARPCYLQPRHMNDIVIDPDGSVRAGTLEAIAERMTFDPPSASYERALRRAVLFTYEAFTSSQHLFDLITDQYSLEPPREMSEGQFKEWKEVRLRPTQARVLDVLGMWLDLPRLYQDDPELVSRIREFLQFVTEPDNLASEARVHLRTIDRLATPLTQQRPPTPQRQRRRALKPRPFPTLSPTPSHSHSVSGTLLLSPTNSRVRSSSPGHSSPVQGYSSPIPRSTSPRLGASSPSPSHGASLSPSHGTTSPLGTSTSMTSLPSSNPRSDESALGRARSQRHTSSSHASSDWSYITSSKTRPAHVASLDPTALAHHLTLLESNLYMRIKRIQCLQWHKTKPEDEANDLRAFCATSDRLAAWVKWSVLSLDSVAKRADAVGVWVRVADKCRMVNNMSSLSAIVAGLTSADVSRLPHTMRHVLSVRAQRLEQLAQMTSPAGGFAALKLIYANDGSGVPFVGMYLTALVHASDQFKDYVPMPDKLSSEPVTPTQTRSRLSIPYGRSSIDSSNASSIISHGSPAVSHASPSAISHASPLISQGSSAISYASSAISHTSAGERTPIEPRTPIPNHPSSPTASTSAPKLLNFTKRHKQSEIIGAMLKFQTWPYTIASNPDAPATTPTTTTYPYPPTNSSLTIHASAGGVAWIEEQLERAAKLTLTTDWTYERSLKLYEDETGGRGGGVENDFMTAAGF